LIIADAVPYARLGVKKQKKTHARARAWIACHEVGSPWPSSCPRQRSSTQGQLSFGCSRQSNQSLSLPATATSTGGHGLIPSQLPVMPRASWQNQCAGQIGGVQEKGDGKVEVTKFV